MALQIQEDYLARYPQAFDVWRLNQQGQWAFVPPTQRCPLGEGDFRLVPLMAPDCPAPTEQMMNNALYLGKGPVRVPEGVTYFEGYLWDPSTPVGCLGWGFKTQFRGFDPDGYYCVDLADKNAEEIVRLNAPYLIRTVEEGDA